MADDFEGRYFGARRLAAALILGAIADLKYPSSRAAAKAWLDSETAAICLDFLDLPVERLPVVLQRYPKGISRREASRLAKVAALADKMQDFS